MGDMFVYRGTVRMDGLPVIMQAPVAAADLEAAWSAALHHDDIVLSNGNKTATADSPDIIGTNCVGLATLPIVAGQQIRIEVSHSGPPSALGGLTGIGIGNSSVDFAGAGHIGDPGNNDIGWLSDGRVFLNNVVIATYATFIESDVLDVDVDFDAGTVEFFKNGVSQGAPVLHGIAGNLFAVFNLKFNGTTPSSITLIEPGSFTHAPPLGFTEYGA